MFFPLFHKENTYVLSLASIATPSLLDFYSVKAFGGGSNPQLKNKEKSPRSEDLRLFSWLGWRDSNPRMSAPKTDALPLGDSPVRCK